MQEEVIWMDSKIQTTKDVIVSLDNDLATLEVEYGKMVRYAFRNNIANSRILFLLSAASFKQAFQRWRYFKLYDGFRRRQLELINWTRENLTHKHEKLLTLQLEKSDLIDEMNGEKRNLGDKLSEQNKMLANLNNDERILMQELQSQQSQSRQLEGTIAELIRVEMNKTKDLQVPVVASLRLRSLGG